MLTVSDKNLKKLGELENVHNVSVERRANQLWSASFTLPKNDPKNELCKHFNYIDIYGPSGRYYGKYRILNIQTGLDTVTYECEHVLGILNNYTMPGYHRFENFTTEDVLKQLLDMQPVKHIRLGKVEFSRRFRYDFENHNGLLSAIFEVPQRFNEPYLFTFDTETYPWTLNLIKPDNEVKWDLRWGRDLGNFEEFSDPTGIVNRIYPFGYGEGVNTLNIRSVNNGVPYIEDKQSIDEYGLVARTWIDKRFEDANSLLEEARAKLSQWKDPRISFSINAVDLSIKKEYQHLTKPLYAVGQIHVDDKVHEARIVGEIIPDLSKEYEVEYEINNKLNELADAQINLERRQYITEAYAQGSTTQDTVVLQDNCDSDFPLEFKIWIPEDVININSMLLTYDTSRFRGYTRGAKAGGHFQQPSTVVSKSTKSGGGVVKSSTTASGGGTVVTSGAAKFSETGDFTLTSGPQPENAQYELHRHRVSLISLQHDHEVKQSPHKHDFEIEIEDHEHEFEVEIPGVNIPDHIHEQIYGVYEHNKLPTSLTIKVDGKTIPYTSLQGQNIDLVPFLNKDNEGKILRNRYVTIEIRPNDLARINASVVSRLFIQSRIGGQF